MWSEVPKKKREMLQSMEKTSKQFHYWLPEQKLCCSFFEIFLYIFFFVLLYFYIYFLFIQSESHTLLNRIYKTIVLRIFSYICCNIFSCVCVVLSSSMSSLNIFPLRKINFKTCKLNRFRYIIFDSIVLVLLKKQYSC